MSDRKKATEETKAEEAGGLEVRRGRPGRRTAGERSQAVLELFAGKATVDLIARRFGVHPTTVEKWREIALEGVGAALRQGSGKSPREQELERKLRGLERAFTDLAIRHELVERALSERPSRPGRSSR
ncbi:MAG TPA: helix-turn-helix domain-containing protein [Candidatus Fermentibacter daniensis]|nr:helix-turn-helix domain-containing protein [Candidatus Fermentibacter daniensis]